MENANYVNKFSILSNAKGQEVLLSFFQVQPIWDESIPGVSHVNTGEVCRLFLTFESAKSLSEALNNCISDWENNNTHKE